MLRKHPHEYTYVENLFPNQMSWQFKKTHIYNAKSNLKILLTTSLANYPAYMAALFKLHDLKNP